MEDPPDLKCSVYSKDFLLNFQIEEQNLLNHNMSENTKFDKFQKFKFIYLHDEETCQHTVSFHIKQMASVFSYFEFAAHNICRDCTSYDGPYSQYTFVKRNVKNE